MTLNSDEVELYVVSVSSNFDSSNFGLGQSSTRFERTGYSLRRFCVGVIWFGSLSDF